MDTQSTSRRADVRRLNDDFRCHNRGRGTRLHTHGVHEKGPQFVLAAYLIVREFNAFDDNSDPYREHDFGAFDLLGERLFFKIDYYDLERAAGSPNPADPAVTHRVLTIMLASEY